MGIVAEKVELKGDAGEFIVQACYDAMKDSATFLQIWMDEGPEDACECLDNSERDAIIQRLEQVGMEMEFLSEQNYEEETFSNANDACFNGQAFLRQFNA